MKIALIGYGKMGQAIEKIALERGHNIGLKISIDNLNDLTKDNIKTCDVAIEFTSPESALSNLEFCLSHQIPVVCGSTGWYKEAHKIETLCHEKKGTLLYASNFSVGVNLFFELNKKLAALMATQNSYTVSMEEIHHTQKLDAPSGTAITLAEQILSAQPQKKGWINDTSTKEDTISIISRRINPAPGTHSIKYSSKIDDIEIIHTAHNREGFAFGAVLAAEYIAGRKGIFKMNDVLSF